MKAMKAMKAVLKIITPGRQDEMEVVIDKDIMKLHVGHSAGYVKNSGEAEYILKELAPMLITLMRDIEKGE